MNRIAYNPSGKSITFTADDHRYIDSDGQPYRSATQFIGSFFPKFDAEKMARTCSSGMNSKYSGRGPEEIMAEWQAEGDRGRDEGTNVHAYAEALMMHYPKALLPAPISHRNEKLFQQVNAAAFKLLRRYQFVGAEVIIFSPALGIAGTVDLLMFDHRAKDLIIFDWKQNKKLSYSNFYQRGLSPIEYLQDCDITHYELQLSLYQMIIETEGYFPEAREYRRELIHLTPEGYEQIPMGPCQYAIKEMINHVQNIR